MAYSYKNLYNVDDISKRLDAQETNLAGLRNSVLNGKDFKRIEDQLKIAQAKVDTVIKQLNNNGADISSIDDLRKNFEASKKSLPNFSGTNIATVFFQDFSSVRQSDKFEKALQKAVGILLQSDPKVPQIVAENKSEYFTDIVLNALNESFKNSTKKSGAKFSSRRGYNQNIVNSTNFIVINDLSEPQLKAFDALLRDKNKLLKFLQTNNKDAQLSSEFESLINDYTSSVNVSNDPNGLRATWQTKTDRKTKSQAKLDPVRTAEINEDMITFLCDNCGNLESSANLRSLLQSMLLTDPEMFFIGRNKNAITGLLGEIQGLYFLCALLNIDYKEGGKLWKGPLTNELGHQFHADISLEQALNEVLNLNVNFQVKNSASDIIADVNKKVGFGGGAKSIEEFFNNFTFSDKIFLNKLYESAQLIYGTYLFNVPYSISKVKKVIDGKERLVDFYYPTRDDVPKDYKSTYNRFQPLMEEIDKYVSLAAASFMFLDVSLTAVSDTNLIFLIGGTALVTAADILSLLVDQFRGNARSNVQVVVGYSKKEVNRNICFYMNHPKTDRNAEGDADDVIKNIAVQPYFNFSFNTKNLLQARRY